MKLIKELKINVNDEIRKKEYIAGKCLSKLEGYLQGCAFPELFSKTIFLKEVINNNKIEKVNTSYNEIISIMIKTQFSDNKNDIRTFHNIDAIKKGIKYIDEHKVIDKNILTDIQKIIRNTDKGIRNDSYVVVSKIDGQITYRPPKNHDDIVLYLNELEKFINVDDYETSIKNCGPLIKMPIVHYQFESIHPFIDGNGRTGRILNMLYLILKKEMQNPIISLSYYIYKTKETYYLKLDKCHAVDENFTGLIDYFLDAIIFSANESINIIENFAKLFKEIDAHEYDIKINHDQILTLFNRLYFNVHDLQKILSISLNTAKKYLKYLIDNDLIIEISYKNKKTKNYAFKNLLNYIDNLDNDPVNNDK